MNLHIVTVGTSILSNAGWRRGQPLPDRGDLQRALDQEPRRASAELNALLHYVNAGRCDRVHLIATDTLEGRFCRDLVGQWLHSQGIQNERGIEAELLAPSPNDPYADDPYEAAARLRDRIFSVAQSASLRNDSIYLNLTGGLKSETAVAAATATLLIIAGISLTAYYAHESMSEPVELPILSIRRDVLGQLSRDFASQEFIRIRYPLDSLLQIAERERIITVRDKTDGNPPLARARLTDFGRFICSRFSMHPS